MEITRRSYTGALLTIAAAASLPFKRGTSLWAETPRSAEGVFRHPGMLHTEADLLRMKLAVRNREQPIFSGFEAFQADRYSQLTYKPSGGTGRGREKSDDMGS